MTEEELRKFLKNITAARIAVIGDFCLDAYWFIDALNVVKSIETGLDIRFVERQKYSLGGAGNLVNNLSSLGVQSIKCYGVVGEDPFGYQLLKLLNGIKADTSNIFQQNEHWDTNVYAKPHAGVFEQNRMDFGCKNILDPAIANLLIQNLGKNIDSLDVIIINQQVTPGFHSAELRGLLRDCIAQHPEKIFIVDSRDFSYEYKGAYLKLNDVEAARLCGVDRNADSNLSYEEVKLYCSEIYNRYQQPVFVTRKEKGLFIQDETGFYQVHGLHIIAPVDTVGAGDSMVAGIATALATGYRPNEAGIFGNFVAGVTIQKLFETGTATAEEILAIGSNPDYVYNPELAEDSRGASHYKSSQIEIINSWPSKLKFTHAIFDHDGTISTLRQGWEFLMEPMMLKAVLGEQYETADTLLFREVQNRILGFIDKTTGIQTIAQMAGLIDIIREFKCVPEGKILTAPEYKAIYNEAILELVDERLVKLRNNELSVEDFTLKNSVAFLTVLREAGIKLYLTSGTDETDVINEAGKLGYAHLFESNIYGSLGDIDNDAKKVVLERILTDIGKEKFASVVTFGDGPVEIRETHKRGGLTVGVASDEIRRHGMNAKKRSRLIKSGADIIVPDFSQPGMLLDLMQIKTNQHVIYPA
ncbi:MAG: PfkB family carbohydrate kinase [Ferruginibacter sp.]